MRYQQEELWAPVRDFPDYIVSSEGRVVNIHTDRLLTPRLDGYGYVRLALRKDGFTHQKYAHRLVAEAFMTGFRPERRIRWLDEDRQNNSISNLRFRKNHGLGQFIEPPEIIVRRRVLIEQLDISFATVSEAARHLQTDPTCIYRVLRGVRDHHLGYTFRFVEIEESYSHE